ncbi:MAG: LacI family transcriptional regulator [Lachnospiraceae bacterium]|nr:LacI family transcriptional regulator [Lachnospiraceae bacterium]
MSVTIRDVAREAGVSTSTISKVLNNWSTISPETCARVRQAIEKLHYTPNAQAVSFAKGAAKNILFLSSLKKEEAYHNPHMFDTLCGVQKELSSHGYTLMLMEPPDNVSPETFLKDQIARRIADGILIHGSCNIPSLSKIMLKYQYENVAFLAERRTDDISMRRLNGFLGGMYDYGYRIPEEYICYTDSTGEDAYRQSMALLSLPEPPRAIVCENSLLALSLCNAIREKRLRVPDEVAFLTFDSYPYSALIEPAPTIIDIDVYDLGVQAAVMLLRKLENPSLLVQTYTTLPILRQGSTTMPVSR